MNQSIRKELAELIQMELDGTLTDEQFNRLCFLLKSYPEARRYYGRTISIIAIFHEPGGIQPAHTETMTDPSGSSLDAAFWRELALNEQTAAPVPIEKMEKPADIPPAAGRAAGPPYRVSRLSLYSLLVSSAALILLISYALLGPAGRGVEVATLTETLNVRWASPERGLREGMRLSTQSKPLRLAEGIAVIQFDNGSRAVLEGPADFTLLTDDQIQLRTGRLFASVPKTAVGFTVSTPFSKIIDLGTEFGIKADPDGMEVHVMAGKTMMISGPAKESKNQYEIREGFAKAVNAAGDVLDIALKKEAFVRRVNPQTQFVWRGQNVNLADIVGGGSGFGTGRIEAGIDPLNGQKVEKITPRYSIKGSGRYELVPWNPFVDGVFVPDPSSKPVVVSSRGDVFEECPATNGEFWTEITNGGQLSDPVELSSPQFRLDGQVYGTADKPAIFMHANLGITFDLEAIRRTLANLKISRFTALAGISENGPRRSPYADFWVLVDGQVRFCRRGADGTEIYSIDVDLKESDRFLTLAVTDGGREKCLWIDGQPYVLDGDWGLFALPQLHLRAE
ncbi:MAG TPA: FecR domain-containing protein [Anaerohalosphaeraceae bacterium]|nr:FecR domain-containing protein [Anaerohalosphaeraceae bacterium]